LQSGPARDAGKTGPWASADRDQSAIASRFDKEVRPRLKGKAFLIRYADGLIGGNLWFTGETADAALAAAEAGVHQDCGEDGA
jgi:hypothetical protein